MPATNLDHVSLIARDLEESVRFCIEVFGMELIPTPNFGFPVQRIRVGPLQLHLFERPGERPPITTRPLLWTTSKPPTGSLSSPACG